MKILNIYAGLGGNRKLWNNASVTAVEFDKKIASIYSRLFPHDTLIIGDAHEYLLKHFSEFDFIWASPPCQSHSKMNKFTRHSKKKYPDMALYQEIIFLQNFFKGKFVIENVKPYYAPLIPATHEIGRHLFWTNFPITAQDVPRPDNFINLCNLKGKVALMEWLGIHYPENIYVKGNHCPAQILRNCVHPLIGKQILTDAINSI